MIAVCYTLQKRMLFQRCKQMLPNWLGSTQIVHASLHVDCCNIDVADLQLNIVVMADKRTV